MLSPSDDQSPEGQLRNALLLSFFPAVIAVVTLVFKLFGGLSLREWFILAGFAVLGVWAFFLCVLVPSLILSRFFGSRLAISTLVHCPHCDHPQLIVNTRCDKCRQRFGVPASSKITYIYSTIGFILFQLVLSRNLAFWELFYALGF